MHVTMQKILISNVKGASSFKAHRQEVLIEKMNR